MATKYPLGPRVRVHVTAEIITKSVTANSTKCMIAESIKAAYPDATAVAVDLATCRFSNLEKFQRFVYTTPLSAQLALIDFDEGKPPAPFSFLLKNAHVTKAGGTTPAKKAKDARRKEKTHALLSQTRLVGGHPKRRELPRRVGGKRPPQLRTMRMFGVRAFRGANLARLKADAAILARAEETETR